jgi:hypothetical protein
VPLAIIVDVTEVTDERVAVDAVLLVRLAGSVGDGTGGRFALAEEATETIDWRE